MTNCVLNKLSTLDLFKRPLYLYVGKKKFNSTVLGLCLSFAIYGYLLNNLFSTDIFSRKNPILFEETFKIHPRPKLTLSVTIPIAVSNNEGENFNDPSMFSIKAKKCLTATGPRSLKGKFALQEQMEEISPCRAADYSDGDFLVKGSMINALCIRPKNVSVSGYWDESEVNYLLITLERCNNDSSKVICKSNEEIDIFFENKSIVYYLPTTRIEISNYDTPFKNDWVFISQKIDVNLFKSQKSFLKKVEFIDDKDYVLNDASTIEAFTFDYYELDLTSSSKGQSLFEILLHPSAEIQKKTRKYEKIREVLADLGGQSSCLMIFGFMITSMQNFVELTSKIMNSLYSFQYIPVNKRNKKGKYRGRNESRQGTLTQLKAASDHVRNNSLVMEFPQSDTVNDKKKVKDPFLGSLYSEEEIPAENRKGANHIKRGNRNNSTSINFQSKISYHNSKQKPQRIKTFSEQNSFAKPKTYIEEPLYGHNRVKSLTLRNNNIFTNDFTNLQIQKGENLEKENQEKIQPSTKEVPGSSLSSKGEFLANSTEKKLVAIEESSQFLIYFDQDSSSTEKPDKINENKTSFHKEKAGVSCKDVVEAGLGNKEMIEPREINGLGQVWCLSHEGCTTNTNRLELIRPDLLKDVREKSKKLAKEKKNRTGSSSHLDKLKLKKDSENQIKFGLLDYIRMNLTRLFQRKLKPKDQLFKQAQDKFRDEINIVKILKRLQDLEKLKLILLSPEQLALFSLLEKPLIYIDNDDQDCGGREYFEKSLTNMNMSSRLRMSIMMKDTKDCDGFSVKKKIEKMGLGYYKKIIQEKNEKKITDIDSRLLMFIDEKIRQVELADGEQE